MRISRLKFAKFEEYFKNKLDGEIFKRINFCVENLSITTVLNITILKEDTPGYRFLRRYLFVWLTSLTFFACVLK